MSNDKAAATYHPSTAPSEPWIMGAIERAAERVLAEPREVHWPLNP